MMSNRTKIALGMALQLLFIGAVGDFVHWNYMNYVYAGAAVSFVLGMIFLIIDTYKNQ